MEIQNPDALNRYIKANAKYIALKGALQFGVGLASGTRQFALVLLYLRRLSSVSVVGTANERFASRLLTLSDQFDEVRHSSVRFCSTSRVKPSMQH
jgi:hypothetical protein